jgi:hypothetical protein
MTEALDRIASDFAEFQRSLADCRSGDSFRPEQWKGAHSALHRVRDRYVWERKRGNLSPEEGRVLWKVFEDDPFIKGMMELRQVGEHVNVRGRGARLTTTRNVPFELTAESSALAVFAAAYVVLEDTRGEEQPLDHWRRLKEAERRICEALEAARGSAPARRVRK